MPTFIDNQGQEVVPSLATLAMANGRLQLSDIIGFDPTKTKAFTEEIQRMGYNDHRDSDLSPIYLAKDLSSVMIPVPMLKIADMSPPPNEITWMYDEPITLAQAGQDVHREAVEKSLWEAAKKTIAGFLKYVTVILVHGYERPIRNYVYLRQIEGNPLFMVISSELLAKLSNEGFDLRPIQKLILDVSGSETFPVGWFPRMPALSHFSTLENPTSMSRLLPVKDTLQELRIFVNAGFTESNFQHVLSQLSSLRLLFADCNSAIRAYPIDWRSLELSPKLRSLTVIGIAPATAADIIGFLTKEVNHRGNAVARQELLDDFTVTGIERGVMEEIYQSDALTRRMKERIFCDISPGHMTSLFLLVSKKIDYGKEVSLTLLFLRASQLLASVEAPPPTMIRVLLQVISHTPRLSNSMVFGLPLLQNLLSTTIMTGSYTVARSILDTVIRLVLEFKRGSIELINISTADRMIVALTMRGVQPTNVWNFLEAITCLMMYPLDPAPFLPYLFLIYVQSSPVLDTFFNEMQRDLSRVCFALIHRHGVPRPGPNQLVLTSIQVDLQDTTIEMLSFILHNTTEIVLWTAANAVLRRSTKGPHEGTWTDLDTDAREQILFVHLFQ